jgi:DNA-binding transcriptional LysR family regulator
MALNRTDLGELNLFATVARHRSFSRAARALGVSPSALSHTVRALEERLGVRLLNRTTRAVSPTDAGEHLLRRLEPAFRDIGDALASVTALRDVPGGTLRLNMPQNAAFLVFAPIVGEFLRRYPQVRLELVAEERMVDVVAAGFDAGIRFGETVPRDMIAVRIGRPHQFSVVGSPSYFRRYPRPETPEDLMAHACIRWPFLGGGYLKWQFERDGTICDLDVDGPLATNEPNTIMGAALDGVGLAYQFGELTEEHVRQGRLIRVLEEWCPSRPGFSLYYPSRRQIPSALVALIALLHERFALCQNMPDWSMNPALVAGG